MKNIFVLSLVLFTLSGCSSNLVKSFVQTPQLKEIKLNSFSAGDKQASFDVAIYNPNLFDIPVTAINGELKLNQVTIGHMSATNPKNSLEALSTQTITIPVKFVESDFIKATKSALLTGVVKYQFIGTIETSVGSAPFVKQGELSMQSLFSSFF